LLLLVAVVERVGTALTQAHCTVGQVVELQPLLEPGRELLEEALKQLVVLQEMATHLAVDFYMEEAETLISLLVDKAEEEEAGTAVAVAITLLVETMVAEAEALLLLDTPTVLHLQL
jgi:hypothetical protein